MGFSTAVDDITTTDDGTVWWKADDPSANEGVEPPPEERNPFKAMPTLLKQMIGEACELDCNGKWISPSQKGERTPNKFLNIKMVSFLSVMVCLRATRKVAMQSLVYKLPES